MTVAFRKKLYNITRSPKSTMENKRQLLNEYVLPVLTYGIGIWALKATTVETLAEAKLKMALIVLGLTLSGRKSNGWIRQQTGVNAMIETIKKGKHGLATSRGPKVDNNRWTIRAMEWTPNSGKEHEGSQMQDGATI